jgi:predicted glycosyltransferase involved in capsule biosynthesis
LHLPKLFPLFGRIIIKRALLDYPVALAATPTTAQSKALPELSFVIGHRGTERIPLLLKTLESIAGQEDCITECIVVEQDQEQKIKHLLPDWVRYVYTPLPSPGIAYSRSWAFNEGARQAKSQRLVFHDNDMVIPKCYASEMCAIFNKGFLFVNLKRFVFYLDKSTSNHYVQDSSNNNLFGLNAIVQNLEGGGSFGACKKSFLEVGGFDERFVGWGGEDNEFWERALTKLTWEYGYLPILHLWHQAQPGKTEFDNSPTKKLLETLSCQPVEQRISYLNKLNKENVPRNSAQ